MTTSASSPETLSGQMEFPWMSSLEGFPVRTSPSPAVAEAWRASARDYGAITPVWLASFDPATSSWRTRQGCLLEGLAGFSESWCRSGTIASGTAYRHPPLVRLTDETVSGWLPTPAATRYGSSNNGCPGAGRTHYRLKGKPSLETMARTNQWPTPNTKDADAGTRKTFKGKTQVQLCHAVRSWPTPTAGDSKASGSRNTPDSNARPGVSLTDAVRQDGGRGRMWPTPIERDWKSCSTASKENSRPLSEHVSGALNPRWVEWLLGLPPGWTEI